MTSFPYARLYEVAHPYKMRLLMVPPLFHRVDRLGNGSVDDRRFVPLFRADAPQTQTAKELSNLFAGDPLSVRAEIRSDPQCIEALMLFADLRKRDG